MSICQLCDQWVDQLQAFLLTLESEFDALKSNQAELITQVAESKLQQLNEFSQTEKALQAAFPDIEANQLVQHLITHCSQHPSTKQLMQVSVEIQKANQRNGMLLQSMMRLNEFGLNLLSGKIDTGDTYGASGQVKSAASTKSLKLATA